jgi:hypothetical protein
MPVVPLTPQTVINQVLGAYDGVDWLDADNANRRATLLLFLQHIYDYVWNFREWEWTFCETDLTAATGDNFAPLPIDPASPPVWLEFGRNGGLWGPDKRRYREVSKYTLERYRQGQATLQRDAGIFTIAGGCIQLPAAATGSLVLTAFHRFAPEILVDANEPAPPATYAFIMPARFVNTVLIPGLVFRMQESKNDARDTWGGQFRDGLAQMCAIENPMKTGTHRLPYAVPNAW